MKKEKVGESEKTETQKKEEAPIDLKTVNTLKEEDFQAEEPSESIELTNELIPDEIEEEIIPEEEQKTEIINTEFSGRACAGRRSND